MIFPTLPLTDLTAKKVPNQIPWGQAEQLAFKKLKTELCKASDESLAIVNFNVGYGDPTHSIRANINNLVSNTSLSKR